MRNCGDETDDDAKVDVDARWDCSGRRRRSWEGFSGEEARSGIQPVGDGCYPCPCNPTFDLQTSLIFSYVAQAPQPARPARFLCRGDGRLHALEGRNER